MARLPDLHQLTTGCRTLGGPGLHTAEQGPTNVTTHHNAVTSTHTATPWLNITTTTQQGHMRHTLTATAALAITLTACAGPQTVSTTPDKTPTAVASKETSSPKQTTAHVGDTLTLGGLKEDEQIAVTIKKWADPAKSNDEYITPQKGMRWVAGQFELTNTGTAVYSDSPGNSAQVADAEGQRFQSTMVGGTLTAGPEMTSDLKLPRGEKALGWIVFEVPKDSKVVSVQFTMNSGFADETGQWNIK